MNKPSEAVVSALVTAGADPRKKNSKGVSLLDLADRLALASIAKILNGVAS